MGKIREATYNDLICVCDICDQPGLEPSEGKSGEYHDWFMDIIKDERGFLYVYIKDDVLVGFIAGETIISRGMLVWALGVDKKFHGIGIGFRLMKHYEDKCKEIGIEWIYADGFVDTIDHEKIKKMGYITNNHLYKGYYKEL